MPPERRSTAFRRYDVCRNLIRVGVAKVEASEFDEEIEASNLRQLTRPRSLRLSGWSVGRHSNSSSLTKE